MMKRSKTQPHRRARVVAYIAGLRRTAPRQPMPDVQVRERIG